MRTVDTSAAGGASLPDQPQRHFRATARPTAITREALLVGALTVLAALLRFYRLGHQGFWFDEANTALLVHFSPGKMIGLIPQTESTPPLYYCVAWVWARVFGYDELGLRSLSALAGVLVVPVAWGAARRLVSTRAGLIAAALTACNPLLIWYSQEARSYELLVLLSGLSVLAFAYFLERPTPRWGFAWLLSAALALATHYYALLVVVPEAVWLMIVHRRRRAVQVSFALVALCGLALIPLALSQHATGRSNWIASAPLARRLEEIAPQFAAGFPAPAYGVLEPLALALAILGLALAGWLGSSVVRRGAFLAAGIAACGLVLNLLLVGAGIDDLLTRNVIALWLPAAIGVAGGFAARRSGLGILATLALCAIGVANTAGIAANRSYQRPDWRGVARLLGARPAPGSGGRAIFIQHYRDLLPLSLYLPGLKFVRRHAGVRVSQLDVVSFTSPPSAGFCWWGSACNLWPSRMQASYRIPGFHPVWRRHVYQFTVLRLVADRGTATVTPHALGRVLTTTSYRNDELLLQR